MPCRIVFGRRWKNKVAILLSMAIWPLISVLTLTAETTPFERALQAKAQTIVTKLEKAGCHRVGVLKFAVRDGDVAASYRRGTLNQLAANYLEAALEHAAGEGGKFEVIPNASKTANAISGADHLTLEGRKRLFSRRYPAAEQRRALKPDAFVTGVIELAPDLKTVNVGFRLVRQGTRAGLEKIGEQFSFPTDGNILVALSESFQRRSTDDPATAALQVRQSPELHFPLPLEEQPANAPVLPTVLLTIFYDGAEVPLDIHEHGVSIPEPKEGQKVTMLLERLDSVPIALAVVIKVNGENVLFRERMQAIDCSKYPLETGAQPVIIKGYQVGEGEFDEFRIASQEEAEAVTPYYGSDLGMVSLVVFQEPNRGRGVIVPGERKQGAIKFVPKREWDPEPIMSAVIRYHRPGASN